MTGKEIVMSIIENDLMDEEFFSNGFIPWIIPSENAALNLNESTAVINASIDMGHLPGGVFGSQHYVCTAQQKIFLEEVNKHRESKHS